MPSAIRQDTATDRPGQLPLGVNDVDYFHGRRQRRQLIYRLQRRTDEVEAALRTYGDGRFRVIVDVGAADGLMMEELQRRMGPVTFLGIDLSFALLRAYSADGVFKAQGDALCIPVKSSAADAVVATAVIEHVPDASAMLRECARILRPDGLLVVTTPDPRMEQIATTIGLLKDPGHQQTFTLKELTELANANGFAVCEVRKFMFSPIGFPAETTIERMLRAFRLNALLANQLLVARRKG